jgi:hypothetical protein
MRIDFRALLHGNLEISMTHVTAHGTTTNTYIISIIPILVIVLVIVLILALLLAVVVKARDWFHKQNPD